MKEMDCRLSIGKAQDLNAGEKLTLIMLLTRLDWQTWEGRVSVRDLAELTAQSERNIKRLLKSITDKGWIERHAERRDDGLHHKALIKLNQGMVTDCHYGSDRLTPQVVTTCHHSSDRLTLGVVTDCPVSSDNLSPKSIDQYIINNNQPDSQSNNQHATPEVELDPTREDELELSRREAIDAGCYIMEPEALYRAFPSFISYNHKLYEITRHKRRQDVRDVIMQHDGFLALRAYELRLAPVSIVDWVMHLAESKRASQAVLRR